MGFNVASITGTLEMDASPTVASFKTAAAESTNYKRVVENDAAAAADSFSRSMKGALADVKGEFGKSSLLGQSLKLLAGGGAIAGIGLGAREFASAAESIAKYSDEIRKGDLSTADAIGEMARAVPVVGDLTRAFDSIAEAVTGSKLALEVQNAELERHVKAMSEVASIHDAGKKAIARQDEYLLRAQEDAAAIAGGAPVERYNAYQDKMRSIAPDAGMRDRTVAAYKAAKSVADAAGQNLKSATAALDVAKAQASQNDSGQYTNADNGATYQSDHAGQFDKDLHKAQADYDAAKAVSDKNSEEASDARNAQLAAEQSYNQEYARYMETRRVLEGNYLASEAKINDEQSRKVAEAGAKEFESQIKAAEHWAGKAFEDVRGLFKGSSVSAYISGITSHESFGPRLVSQADQAGLADTKKIASNSDLMVQKIGDVVNAVKTMGTIAILPLLP